MFLLGQPAKENQLYDVYIAILVYFLCMHMLVLQMYLMCWHSFLQAMAALAALSFFTRTGMPGVVPPLPQV